MFCIGPPPITRHDIVLLQTIMLQQAEDLNPLLLRSHKGSRKSWQNSPNNYLAKHPHHRFVPGNVNLSPAWYALGHQVCGNTISEWAP